MTIILSSETNDITCNKATVYEVLFLNKELLFSTLVPPIFYTFFIYTETFYFFCLWNNMNNTF